MVGRILGRGALATLAVGVVRVLLAFQAHALLPAMIVLGPVKAAAQTKSAGDVLPGWSLKINAGKPDISVGEPGDDAVVRFRSDKASYGLNRDLDVDLLQMPYFSWRWKVTQLPRGGDFRNSSTDDQAAQVLIGFADRRILTYIWDTSAPLGSMQSASPIPLIHVFAIVCRSGAADANRWVNEQRNVAADYQKAFGRPAPHVKGLRIQINSQHTGTAAESYFGEMAFHNAQS